MTENDVTSVYTMTYRRNISENDGKNHGNSSVYKSNGYFLRHHLSWVFRDLRSISRAVATDPLHIYIYSLYIYIILCIYIYCIYIYPNVCNSISNKSQSEHGSKPWCPVAHPSFELCHTFDQSRFTVSYAIFKYTYIYITFINLYITFINLSIYFLVYPYISQYDCMWKWCQMAIPIGNIMVNHLI